MNKPLDCRQLQTFTTVAQTGSFTTAARKLFMTQSAVSHQIKALESEIGSPLFERARKKVYLTAAGQLLHPYAVVILTQLVEAREAVAGLKADTGGCLRMGSAATVCEYLLPPVLRGFRKRFPRNQILIEPGDTLPLVERLLADHLDFAIVLLPVKNPSLQTLELFEDELVAVVPPNHPWATQSTVPLHDIPAQSFILYSRKSITYQLLEKFLRSKDLEVPSFIETGEADVIKAMVAMELGVGVVAPWIVEREVRQKTLVTVPFKSNQLRRRWGIVSHKGKRWPASHRAFLGLCRNFLSPTAARH